MSRYIDADSIRKAVEYIPWCEYDEVQKVIDEEPTADVAPVIHAKWIDAKYHVTTASGSNDVYTCSNCHEDTECEDEYDYCPHCGAKMDLEDIE